jgi:hypothetical protein
MSRSWLLPLAAFAWLAGGARAAGAACVPDTYFTPPVSLTTGTNPLFAALADLDADGIPDLVVSNSNFLHGGISRVAIRRGLGGGDFAAPALLASGLEPHGIVIRDFDGDGALDLAIANTESGFIAIHRGQKTAGVANGTFGPPEVVSTAGKPFQITCGDFNEDGILDLAAAINDLPRVSVMLGQGAGGIGDGTFGAPQTHPLAHLGVAIEQGDFDNDGNLDLVATEYLNGTIAFLRGGGNGSFAAPVHIAAGPEPFDLEVLDYDGDERLDLAVANSSSGGVHVLRGLGGGSFGVATTLASGNSSSVEALDVDGDGVTDLLVSQTAGASRMRLYLGAGAGGVGIGSWVEQPPIAMSSDPYQVVATDLDGDAAPDLVVTHFLANDVSVLLGGCLEATVDPRAPVLTDVRDVPFDDGGRVYLTWLRSSLDVPGGAVTSYRVWRRIPPVAGAAIAPGEGAPTGTRTTRSERGPDGELRVTYWESLETLPAQRLEGYGYTAATTEDSSKTNPVSTAFFVSALTANIDVSYPSNVDSAGSVDNLAPDAPQNLRITGVASSSFAFAWSPPAAADVRAYRVYRGGTPDFPPVPEFYVGEASDTTFVDPAPAPGAHYRVTAVDLAGNTSPASPTLTGAVVSAGSVGPRLALAAPRPNPARGGRASLVVSLPGDGPAELAVFDAHGRRVAAPSLAGLGRGEHAVRLGGARPLPAGVYWARLAQDGRRVETKFVMLD